MIGEHTDQGGQLDVINNLYNDDSTFKKMISIVATGIQNLFAGTDPDEPIMNAAKDEPRLTIVPGKPQS